MISSRMRFGGLVLLDTFLVRQPIVSEEAQVPPCQRSASVDAHLSVLVHQLPLDFFELHHPGLELPHDEVHVASGPDHVALDFHVASGSDHAELDHHPCRQFCVLPSFISRLSSDGSAGNSDRSLASSFQKDIAHLSDRGSLGRRPVDRMAQNWSKAQPT